jgi:putative ABC transport system permease protein
MSSWPSTIDRFVFSNVIHRPVRALLSVLAIAVEVAMILTLVGVSHGTLDATASRARGVGADIMIRPPGSSIIGLSSAPMSDRLVPMLMKQPHVALATGTVVQPLAGLDTINGLDLPAFNKMSGGFHFLQGGPFQKDDDILVDEYYAKEHHLHVGDTVQLINHDWHLCGIFESGKLTRIAVRLPVLQELTGNPHHLSQVYIKVDNPGRTPEVVAGLKTLLPGYPIYTMEEFTSLLTVNSVGLLRNFIGVVIGVAVVVGFIVVYMAMYTAVLERTREIGILKSMGASSALILSLLLKETLVLAASGTVAGILLTYAAQWFMKYFVPSSLVQETVYAWWPIAAGIAIAGAVMGAIIPVMKAVSQDVTTALAYE